MMNLNKDEMSLILDGLAALPLARSYNLFQKCLVEFRALEGQPEVPLYTGSGGPQLTNGEAKDHLGVETP